MKATIITAAAALALTACTGSEITMVVGTYTDGCTSLGLYSYRFDQDKGVLAAPGEEHYPEAPGAVGRVELRNPSYFTFSKDRHLIYAVSELADSNASASTISFDNKTGGMELLNTELTGGMDPCYISTNGKCVLTANYTSGSVTELPLDKDGMLLGRDYLYMTQAGGPDTTRQNLPHAHCVLFNAAGTDVLISEFSADAVTRMDLATHETMRIQLPQDFGPRHIIMNHDESRAYVIGELSGDIAVIDQASDKVIQTICADKSHARGSADIRLSPDGKFLYASNRLQDDGIAIFQVNADGTLDYICYQCTGLHPRNFRITPNGKFLLVACRDSNVIQVFRRDKKDGLLYRTSSSIVLDKPVCIDFAR